MKYILLVIIIFLAATAANAQSKRVVDSLDALLSRKIPDTTRINTLNDYAYIMSNTSLYFSYKYTLQALALSRKIQYKRGEAFALSSLGNFGAFADPRVTPKQWSDTLSVAVKIAEETNDHALIAHCCFQKTDFAVTDKDTVGAYRFYTKGLAQAHKANNDLIWRREKQVRSLIAYSLKSDTALSVRILDTLFSYSLDHLSEYIPLSSTKLGFQYLDRANSYYKTDSTLMLKAIGRIQGTLSQNGTATDKHKEAELNYLIGIYHFYQGNYTSALRSCERAHSLFSSVGSIYDDNAVIITRVSLSFMLNNKDEILKYGKEFINNSEKMGDVWAQADAYTNLGYLYKQQNNPAMSADNYSKAKQLSDKLGANGLLMQYKIAQSLGYVYVEMRQYAKAREYFNQALQIAESTNNEGFKIEVYYRLGNSYFYAKQPDSAMIYYKKELASANKTNKFWELNALLNIALSFSDMGKTDSASRYAEYSLSTFESFIKELPEYSKKFAFDYFNQWYNHTMSSIYFHKNMYDSAVIYGEKAMTVFTKAGDKNGLKLTTDILWQSYKAKHDYINALDYFEKYRSIRDSLENSELSNQLSFAETSVEIERKKNEIELLKRDGKLQEAHLKEQELLSMQIKLESIARLKENQALTSSNLLNEETIKRQNQEQKTLEALAAKQRQENKLLAQEKEIQDAVVKQQRLTNYATGGGLGLMALFAIVLFRSNRQKNRQNLIIQAEREKVTVEREKSDALLLNVLPASIAARLKAGERNIADHYESISILFADIVGFTPLSARYAPREMVAMLNNLYTRFDRLTETHGVERIKTIGDAYMVVSGAPEVCANHAERIAGFALEMQEELQKFSTEINEKIELRIGISCGEAVGAVVGEKKFAYDLWSDAVNTASRMESHGEAGKIHVSEEYALQFTTQNGHLPQYSFHSRGEIEIKGKGIMKTYFLEYHKIGIR
jgi:class 3 adenylate cyclase/tetratricopeptide (TPR) repeat protein